MAWVLVFEVASVRFYYLLFVARARFSAAAKRSHGKNLAGGFLAATCERGLYGLLCSSG